MLDYEQINEFKELILRVPAQNINPIIELTKISNILKINLINSMIRNLTQNKDLITSKELKIMKLYVDILFSLYNLKHTSKYVNRRRFTDKEIMESLYKKR